MSKHSQEPWKRGGRLQCARIMDANGDTIAVVFGANAGGRYSKHDKDGRERHERAMANRALMASAPELLQALKEVLAISDRKHNAWDKARAAIAKAEGR